MKDIDKNINYRQLCASMTPLERLQKSYELGEWAKKMNKHYHLELEKRLKNSFVLR